jgi:hypothetical protein
VDLLRLSSVSWINVMRRRPKGDALLRGGAFTRRAARKEGVPNKATAAKAAAIEASGLTPEQLTRLLQ